MDYEEAYELLLVLKDKISASQIIKEEKKKRCIESINRIEELLTECRTSYNVSAPTIIIGSLQISENRLTEQDDDYFLLRRLNMCESQLQIQCASKQVALNSKAFYEEEISSLKAQISSLNNELKSAGKVNSQNQSLIRDKEKELSILGARLVEYQKNEEQAKIREDARAMWSNNIKAAFGTLRTGLDPIQAEKQRLNILYYTYCGLSALLILFLTVVEVIITCKLENYYGVPQFKEYLSLIAPIPVALALLFVFMTQINRAQRQLVAIAKYIHDIEYTEEIMQAINSLSIDIDDSMKRINNSMDRLLERHLACNLNYLEETSLKEQEDKDKRLIPAEQVTELLKGIISNSN